MTLTIPRNVVTVALCILTSAPIFAQQSPAPADPGAVRQVQGNVFLPEYTSEERLRDYVKRTIGLRPFLSSAAGAGIQQARNTPSAWGQGMEGYSRRFGSSFAKRGISNTVQLGVEAILMEDSRYVYSQQPRFWPRLKDAVKQSLIVRKGDGREFAVGRLAGTMAAGMLSRKWQPEGHQSFRDGLQSGGISFGGYVAWNVFREFSRTIQHHLPF